MFSDFLASSCPLQWQSVTIARSEVSKAESVTPFLQQQRLERLALGPIKVYYLDIFHTIFEYNEAKSKSNFLKHGIDFERAQALWNDPDLLEIPAKAVDEPRYVLIGKIDSRHWSAIVTYRRKNIRIISVRRSRSEEKRLYESQ